MQEYIEPLRTIMADASHAIMEVYKRDFSIYEKEDKSPLTEADLKSHDIIFAGLQSLGEVPILSEEGKDIPWEERQHWERYWLVDPIDGTKEFIKKNGEFTVNIALIERNVPVMGVVAVPVLGVMYFGMRGVGAWKESNNGIRTELTVRTPPAEKGWRIVGSRSHLSDTTKALAQWLPGSEFVSMGSSLKFCVVAEGNADIYPRFGPTSEWDTAAAQAVVEAAGGQVVKLNLEPLRYNQKDSLLNPYFVVCAEISTAWAEFVEPLAFDI